MKKEIDDHLCTIDIKIDKKIHKLKVKSSDDISKLANRLTQLLGKATDHTKLCNKLSQQINRLLQQGTLTAKIKSKFGQILTPRQQNNTYVIQQLPSQEISKSIETPFRILQDSILNARKTSQQKHKKHYNYFREDSQLNVKLRGDSITQVFQKCHISDSPQKTFKRSPYQTQNNSNLNNGPFNILKNNPIQTHFQPTFKQNHPSIQGNTKRGDQQLRRNYQSASSALLGNKNTQIRRQYDYLQMENIAEKLPPTRKHEKLQTMWQTKYDARREESQALKAKKLSRDYTSRTDTWNQIQDRNPVHLQRKQSQIQIRNYDQFRVPATTFQQYKVGRSKSNTGLGIGINNIGVTGCQSGVNRKRRSYLCDQGISLQRSDQYEGGRKYSYLYDNN